VKKTVFAFLCVFALFLPGCSKAKKPDAEISVFIWTEYLPEEVCEKFQKDYNVKVNVETYSSPGDLYAKMRAAPPGTYDVVCATEFYIKRLSDEGYLEKLDHANLPNIKYLIPEYLNKYYDPGNVYSVPYLNTMCLIAVNTEKVTTPVAGLADLYRDEFRSSLVLLDDFQTIIGAVNLMNGFDFNETDPQKLALTAEKLLELKPNVRMLDSDSPKSALLSGECTAGLIWSAEIAIAMEENQNIKVVFPVEGYNVALDSLTVAKGTKNKEWAEKFINFILDPEVSAMISADYPYINPNTGALELLGPEFRGNLAKNPPAEVIKEGIEMFDLDNDTLSLYDSMWTRFTTK